MVNYKFEIMKMPRLYRDDEEEIIVFSEMGFVLFVIGMGTIGCLMTVLILTLVGGI